MGAGVPDSASVQEVIFWQGRTIQMMYHIIGQAMQRAGVQNQHPKDYLSFFCLGMFRHLFLSSSCLRALNHSLYHAFTHLLAHCLPRSFSHPLTRSTRLFACVCAPPLVCSLVHAFMPHSCTTASGPSWKCQSSTPSLVSDRHSLELCANRFTLHVCITRSSLHGSLLAMITPLGCYC